MKTTIKRILFACFVLSASSLSATAQNFGFGGQQLSAEDMKYSEKFTDINYADDGQAYHTLDLYLPAEKKDKYPVVVHIYGSAWFSNNGKNNADLGTIVKALLSAGYAVACPNHRASTEARWPAQCHDIKAVIRYLRGNAERYHLDPSFIATSGFSSGGHLSSFMGATSGTKKGKVGSVEIDIEGNLGSYTNADSRVDAVVDWSGPIDLRKMDCAGKRDMQMSPEEVLLGKPLDGNEDLYSTLSPISFLDKNDPPVVIFHGKQDNIVPFCQGHEFYNSCLDHGLTVRFYQEEEGGHGFKMYTEENLGNMVKFLNEARAKKAANDNTPHNPVVQTWFTTDPAPMVHNGRLYIYTGHDEEKADFFWMQEWRVYSTADMVNWQDHGSPLAIEDFSWGDDRAWAPQCIERNGKFYFYVPLHSKLSGTMAIGVAVGDSPVGPFKDAVGKPLADGSWDYIDPTVFIDDDGQAWLYWGNPQLYYAKLNDDMISFKDGVHKMNMEGLEGYTEGPWIQKRDGKYYMMYASHGIPENISYAIGDSPVGPWKYQGIIMKKDQQASFTNHSGLADFKGKSYFFYHTGWLPGGGGFGRSVAVEEFKYNADGTIPEIKPSRSGVEAVATFNPYRKVEAETISFCSGIKTQQYGKPTKTGSMGGNVYLSDMHNGSWLRVSNVDFGTANGKDITFSASCASALRGGKIEIHLDSAKGEKIGEVEITNTGGWEKFKTFTVNNVKRPEGVHDMYFVFTGRKGPELFSFDWWQMK